MRNEGAHDSTISNERNAEEMHENFQILLNSYRDQTGLNWNNYKIIVPGSGTRISDVSYRINTTVLQGPTRPFYPDVIETDNMLIENMMYMHSADRPLELIHW